MGNAQAAPRHEPVMPVPAPAPRPRQEVLPRTVPRHRPPPAVIEPPRTQPVCRYYARGICSRGDACRFSHETTVIAKPPRSQAPCRYFLRGHCTKGDKCMFSHDRPSGQEDTTIEHDDSLFSWRRQLRGARVEFGEGALPKTVTLPMDFSAIRIGKLPEPCSEDTLVRLLSDVGVNVSQNKVRLIQHSTTKQYSGIITVKDPTFAQTACRKLRSCVTNKGLEIIPTSARPPQGFNTHRINCTQVNCSWDKPKRTATLYFGTQEPAVGVHARFKIGKYKVKGSAVKKLFMKPLGNPPSGDPWIVHIQDLWQVSKVADVIQDIGEQEMPYRVELGDPDYFYDIDMQSTQVQSMLDRFGLLDRWDLDDDPKSPKVVAKATFVEHSSALDAGSSLNGRVLPFYAGGKIRIENDISVEVTVSRRVYDITREQIKDNERSWSQDGVHLTVQQQEARRILRLKGANHKHVAKAQQELKHIVSGKVIKVQGLETSRKDFSAIGRIGRALPKIENKHGVLIAQEVQACQFRVFGPPAKHHRVAEELRRLMQEMASETHKIPLEDDSEFDWALRGGFKALQLHLGRDKAHFDKRSRLITIFGATEEYNEAKVVMARRQLRPTTYHTDCPICLCTPEDPLRTSCFHIFCRSCFSNMCLAAARECKPISCEGDDGQCKKIVLLQEVYKAVGAEVFEDILSLSFSSYIKTNPASFRYCPTPDCDQIYRVTTSSMEAARVFTCGQCLESTCTTCHRLHPGLTCEQQKGYVPNELDDLKKAKNKMGAKDCAKCGTSIQKGEGCNHVICGGCKADICWVCEAVFSRPEDCYDHMRRLHGGIHA